jgi:UDP-2,3-diacylglucosamine pyrophosphatase LpxH
MQLVMLQEVNNFKNPEEQIFQTNFKLYSSILRGKSSASALAVRLLHQTAQPRLQVCTLLLAHGNQVCASGSSKYHPNGIMFPTLMYTCHQPIFRVTVDAWIS